MHTINISGNKKGKMMVAVQKDLHRLCSQIEYQLNNIKYAQYMGGKLRKKKVFGDKIATEIVVVQSDDDNCLNIPLRSKSRKLNMINLEEDSENIRNLYEKIPQIPCVRLTRKDMSGDPIALVMKLQAKYKYYGAVKLIACEQWEPPFSFKYSQQTIPTRIQKIHKLSKGKPFRQNHEQFTIKTFTTFAIDFQTQYKHKFPKTGHSHEAQLQYQYWQTIDNANESNNNNRSSSNGKRQPGFYKTTVEYAADLPVRKYGSGFPRFDCKRSQDSYFDYANSLYNLNNIYKSPQSLLQVLKQKERHISGITMPWVYMGMLFSTFCWHVEDLWLNSINYSHKGAIKTWYVIPEADKEKFDQYVLRKTGKRQFLDSITYMINPLQLLNNGIKVYKAYQRPKEYICTLFKAYHCGFSQGFNVGEAVNFAFANSLEVIKKAEISRNMQKQSRPLVMCHDWLVYSNFTHKILSNPIVPSSLTQLQKQYDKLLRDQYNLLFKLLPTLTILEMNTIDDDSGYDQHCCSVCRNYTYLSFFKCLKCLRNYCLTHASCCCDEGLAFWSRSQDSSREKITTLVTKHMTISLNLNLSQTNTEQK